MLHDTVTAAAIERARHRIGQAENLADPTAWVQHELGEHLWSKQREIAGKIALKTPRIAVPSCHSSGKSHTASRMVAWWQAAHPPEETMIVTTAPTYAQVRTILWRYIRQVHRKAGLQGQIVGSPMESWTVDGNLVAFGRKPGGGKKDADPEAMATFQGIHARYLLVVLDEACGIPRWLWDAIESLATADGNVVLAIGNPDDPESRFAEVCRAGSGWDTVRIRAQDTPNFTGEDVPEEVRSLLISEAWAERAKQNWGEHSALYKAKVDAEFADGAADQTIPAGWIAACRYLDADDIAALNPMGELPEGGVLGVDPARSENGDKNTIVARHRGVMRVVACWNEPDSMKLADRVELEAKAGGPDWQVVIDAAGLGGPVADILRRRGIKVVEFRGSDAPKRPDRYLNARAESWWEARQAIQRLGVSLPAAGEFADQLAADLGAPRWHANNKRQVIQIEAKDEIRKRLGRSPDLGDAGVLALWQPPMRVDPTAGHGPDARRVAKGPAANIMNEPW